MIGKTISHYHIIKKLGGGGMGIVYQAEDLKLERSVAIKFLPPALSNDPNAKERFIHEAKSASALQHNNICTIHEIDETADGQIFIVMDYYQGETLKNRINVGESHVGAIPVIALIIDECINIAIQIAEGLAQAHARNIIHRDVKPANIFITTDNQVKLLDFGLAKFTGQSKLTLEGGTVGTISYMSPEQARGEEVDRRSDIWSLGVILYEMLTGKLPFRGDYDQAIIYSILNEPPKTVLEAGKKIPDQLNSIITRCLEKNKESRYQKITDLIADLNLLKMEPGTLHTGQKISPYKNMRYWIGGTAVVILLLMALFFNPFERGTDQIIYSSDTSTAHKKSLAVLYVENLSAQADADVLCAGITEGVITSLTKLGKLNVKTRSDVLPYKNKPLDLSDLKDDLNIDAVLQSSITLAGAKIQIDARLFDMANENSIWTNQFEANKEDMLSVQNQIAQQVARALGVRLEDIQSDILSVQPTLNPKAFEWASQGIYYKDRGMLDFAMATFDSAIRHDPGYALAHFYQGEVYEKLEKYAQAIHSYQLALPKSEKFQRILWNWPGPAGEKLQWQMRLDDLGIEQKNLVFSIQRDINNNTSTLNAFNVTKKLPIWTQKIPAVIYDYQCKVHNNKLMICATLGSSNNPVGINIYAINIHTGEIISEKAVARSFDFSVWVHEDTQFLSNLNERHDVPLLLLMYTMHTQQLEILNIGQGDSPFKTIFKYDEPQLTGLDCIIFPSSPGKYNLLLWWQQKNLTLIDTEDGKILWESRANSPQIGFWKQRDQTTIFSANLDYTEVQAIDVQTGKRKWTYQTDAGVKDLSVEPRENLVLVTQANGKVTALRMDKGLFDWSRKAWQVGTGDPELKIYSHDPKHENYLPLLYLVSPNGNITTVYKLNGMIVSRINTGDEIKWLYIHYGDVFGTAPHKFFKLDAQQGTIQWTVHHSSSNCWPWAKIDDRLIVLMNHLVSAYDLEYGDLLWQFHTESMYTPLYTNHEDKKVLVGDDYNLYELNLKSNPEDKIIDEKKILFNMARCSAAQGQYEPAINLLQQITTQIDPGYYPAYKELAQVNRTMKNQDLEIKNLVKYSDFFPLNSVESKWVQNRLTETSSLLWIKGFSKNYISYLVRIDTTLYGSTVRYNRDTYLTAFNIKNGETLWSKKFFEIANVRERVCDDDNIYIGAGSKSSLNNYDESIVVAIAKKSGATIWQKDFGRDISVTIDNIRVKNGRIYVLGKTVAKNFITCCLTSNGEPVWSIEKKAGGIEYFELDTENLIYTTRDSLFFIDLQAGTEIWNYALPDSATIEDFTFKGIQNDRIIFTTKDGYFICMNTALRKMEWKIKSPFQITGYLPAVEIASGDTVGDWDAYRFIAFRPDPTDKTKTKLLWKTEIDAGIQYIHGYDDKYIYIKSEDDHLFTLNRITGKIIKKKPLLWESPSGRGIVIDKNILYSNSERLLYAMRLN